MIRLDKYLCEMSIGSRSQVKEYIKKGRVKVDNEVVKSADVKIDENSAIITFDDKVTSVPSSTITVNNLKTVINLKQTDNIKKELEIKPNYIIHTNNIKETIYQ